MQFKAPIGDLATRSLVRSTLEFHRNFRQFRIYLTDWDPYTAGQIVSISRGGCQSVEPRERLVDPYVAAVIEASGVYLDTVAELARECA